MQPSCTVSSHTITHPAEPFVLFLSSVELPLLLSMGDLAMCRHALPSQPELSHSTVMPLFTPNSKLSFASTHSVLLWTSHASFLFSHRLNSFTTQAHSPHLFVHQIALSPSLLSLSLSSSLVPLTFTSNSEMNRTSFVWLPSQAQITNSFDSITNLSYLAQTSGRSQTFF